MRELLDKKMSDLTVSEFITVMQQVNNKKPKRQPEKDDFIEQLITDHYEKTPFNIPETKLSDIHIHLSTVAYLSKKQLASTLRQMGYMDKVKAVKGGTTARFYSARLKANE